MMTIEDCIDEFKLYVNSYCAESTVEYYYLNMNLLQQFLYGVYGTLKIDINILQKKDFVGYIAYHKSRFIKNTSVRTYARAAKVFFKYCYSEGYLLNDITRNVKYPKPDNAIIIPLTSDRVELLKTKILMSALPERNYCIFKLMLDCGLRLSEVCNLDFRDIDFKNHFVVIRNTKNCKSRLIPLPAELESIILKYIAVSGRDVRFINSSECLFLENDGKTRITANAISIMFAKLKVIDPDVYPHLLRHTFATSFVLGGGSLEVLRVLMGHENYNVTKQYLHIASQLQIADFDIYKLDDIFFKAYNYNKRE